MRRLEFKVACSHNFAISLVQDEVRFYNPVGKSAMNIHIADVRVTYTLEKRRLKI